MKTGTHFRERVRVYNAAGQEADLVEKLKADLDK